MERVPFTVESIATIDGLIDAMKCGPCELVVLAERDRPGRPTGGAVRRLRVQYPLTPILAVVEPGQWRSAHVLALARAGIHGIVLRGISDDVTTLRGVLQDDLTVRQSADDVFQAISGRLAPRARSIVRYLLDRPSDPPTVEELASEIGSNARTLNRRLRRIGLPPPHELLTWSRILLAAAMLREPGRPIEHVAHHLAFPSGNSFRNTLRRYVGVSPCELRGGQALAKAIDAFSERWKALSA